MALSVDQKIKLRVSRQIILTGILLGLVYIFFSKGPTEADQYAFYRFRNGALVGLFLGICISFLELVVFTTGIRKLKFGILLTLRTIIYLLLCSFIIFQVVALSDMARYDLSYRQVLESEIFLHDYVINGDFRYAVLFALAFAFSINFTRMISRKMGQGVLLSFITGRYFIPTTEQRFVMFLRLANSKMIEQELSGYQFHSFLKEYFYSITEPIIRHQGIIYEYVEDLIVISWSMEKGERNANCLRTFFEIKEALKDHAEKFMMKYNIIPIPQASLHTGELVRAEIGNIKTQVVFHGDVMNTCARMLDQTEVLNHEYLVSQDVIDIIDVPFLFEANNVGNYSLKGKSVPVELFSIEDKELTRI